MKETITRTLDRYRRTFVDFTTGQKVVAVLGTLALLLGGFMIFRWAAAPTYAPLYSNLSAEDASAVVEQLDASGVAYELAGDGSTVMVPRDLVYSTRIDLSGEGLPSSSASGYSILDDTGLSTSQDQWDTSFKRAMEGELSSTVGALKDVKNAVVHLALPKKQVFADEQDPSTASVLVETKPGRTLSSEQVQAVVHLVASSIDGMDPANVTVADSSGKVLTTPDGPGGASSARAEQTSAVQGDMQKRLQTMLDQVVGAGNSTVQVTADLDFDQTVTETTDYNQAEQPVPLSSRTSEETYTGPAAAGAAGGVVGVDGQMDPTAGGGGDSAYEKRDTTTDNGVDKTVTQRQSAPGAVTAYNVGVMLDSDTTGNIDPAMIQAQVAAITGGTGAIEVSSMPFDRSFEESAAEELAAAEAAEAAAARADLIRNAGIAGGVLLILLLAWIRARRRAKARAQATSYVVEQLKADQARAAALEAPAALALEQAEESEEDAMQNELDALIERQPEDVATLLRGWLVESR
ncbi:MAG TPA: flagellar basal-body MS-ring/collar protein FliF [Nocardioides sp.]|jgi:flagellar M-ring protein FliF|uniref:flagellar basal-body MS-ring/collar protein FliF n=1 Tax=Nocardioides sp. TaxID=35761 RepID=UPI002C07806B|nr:flagellar basal-body MS-ring/collar protein FliF [Nocardioides sp.]HTW13764.1 flagellar basal-body MS-ring/collar protein FliF [Nocardioides sp.]